MDHHVPRPIVVKQSAPVRQSVMSLLGIYTIQLDSIEERKEATFFRITTQMCNGQSFKTSRRYNDFIAFAKDLQNCGDIEVNCTSLPRKHLFGCTGRRLLIRKQKLLLWLQKVLTSPVKAFCSTVKSSLSPKAGSAMSRHLKCLVVQLLFNDFLDINDEDQAQPLWRSPYAPVPEEAASGGQELQIQVPPNMKAGQVMAFSVTDGKKLSVQIPDGVVGGSLWYLWYNSAVDSLTSLPSRKYVPELYLDCQQGSLLEVTIPSGCKAGDLIVIVVPSGMRIMLAVPLGSVAGSLLQMWFECTDQSLTIL